jgi:hypothetical protein
MQTVSGTGEATVADIALLERMPASAWKWSTSAAEVTLAGESARRRRTIPRMVLGYMIKDRLGQPMYGTNTHLKELPLDGHRRRRSKSFTASVFRCQPRARAPIPSPPRSSAPKRTSSTTTNGATWHWCSR